MYSVMNVLFLFTLTRVTVVRIYKMVSIIIIILGLVDIDSGLELWLLCGRWEWYKVTWYTLIQAYWWRGWIGFRIVGFGLQNLHNLWIFVVNCADLWILKTQWNVDELWILTQILDCACLDVRILGPKRNLDHRSFFSLGRYVN